MFYTDYSQKVFNVERTLIYRDLFFIKIDE